MPATRAAAAADADTTVQILLRVAGMSIVLRPGSRVRVSGLGSRVGSGVG
jgi:hypothetical protein